MRPLSPTPGPSRPAPPKRKADDDLADLMIDMTLGKGKAPSKRVRAESPEAAPPPLPAAEASGSRKRRASVDESGEDGPSARAADAPKRSRLVPRGQTEKAWAGGDRDFRNPDGSSVHKPLQGPITVHFGHGTVVIGNGASVKIDHPDGTTVLSTPGEAPRVIKPFGRPGDALPGGGRIEHLGNGDTRVFLPDRVVTHFGGGLTRTEMHPAMEGQRGFYETDSDGAHRFVAKDAIG